MHDPAPPTAGPDGTEAHPAYALVSATRVTHSRGAVLFDSDLAHRQTIRVTVARATRRRDLSTDWIHATGPALVELDLSEAQWAAFVSSMNTPGVPCTLRATETDHDLPGLDLAPRLAASMDEARNAADKAFEQSRAALAAYEDALASGGAKDKRDALGRLRAALTNAAPNVAYASTRLAEHAENVVTKARADIEAMAAQQAAHLALPAPDPDRVLPAAPDGPQDPA
jgi:hypothetical protein